VNNGGGMTVFTRIAPAFAALLLLAGCFAAPGKFVSTLDIRADRSFAFTFKGEILAVDMDKLDDMGDDLPLGDESSEGENSAYRTIALLQEDAGKAGKGDEDFTDAVKDDADKDKRMAAIADALAKEKGFRSARYVGNDIFEVDYAISGTLTHSFVFPFNSDAKLVFPFIALELRGDDRVRVKAPGYANSADKSQSMGMNGGANKAAERLDGTFTLTTNAEIVSQNQEDGATKGTTGQTVTWKVNSLTTEAPMAVIRFPKP